MPQSGSVGRKRPGWCAMAESFDVCSKHLRIALERVATVQRVRQCGCGDYRAAKAELVQAILDLSGPLLDVLADIETQPTTPQNVTRCRFDGRCREAAAVVCLARAHGES